MARKIWEFSSTEYRQKLIKKFIQEEIKKQSIYIKDFFGQDFPLKIVVRTKGSRSFGGCRWSTKHPGEITGYINLGIRWQIEEREWNYFNEYKEILEDPDIGYVEGNSEKCISAMIAHELAHVAVIYFRVSDPWLLRVKLKELYKTIQKDYEISAKGHGKNWQTVYCFLRQKFVNDIEVSSNISSFNKNKNEVYYKQIWEAAGNLIAASADGKEL